MLARDAGGPRLQRAGNDGETGVGWPSGQRDDMGHTEESDVREARPPTLELIETGKNGSAQLK